ncbi:ABC-F family ATP-binding cassette domain-containing protein [Bacillus alkalicellulosilyticus]|uniref:ABC-F family ATP-binding cassette domain-containing protein n=1 Tax=Alkalihalobacterium alkalicellulosilyticum TaxID=1912214 RepID=UPI0009979E4F|nr:ABC-F family ATP-binding cassette domain-containing protein [Bacillus alkalicellulosilyticus]
MTILLAEELYKSYGEKVLFNEISFSIAPKQRIGLIGTNGTGKSTLLKVIAGIETAEKGKIKHANHMTIEYLPQQPQLDETLTVLDQIYFGDSFMMKAMREYERVLSQLELQPESAQLQSQLLQAQQKMDEHDAWDAISVAKTILSRLGITDYFKKVAELSGGQKKRVAIAKALIHPADLLILDEPTNHLDNMTIEWLEMYLTQYKGSLIVVTHDRYFLNRVTNLIYELDHGQLYIYEGNYETFLGKKAERLANEEQQESKRQNLLRREIAWLQRGAKARTTKQKARIQRAEALKEQSGPVSTEHLDFSIGSVRLGKKVIELQEISKKYNEKKMFEDVCYLITPGERLGIVGPNGSGKTTLLNILAGRIQPDSGTVEIGETVKIGYYTQDDEEINGELRVIDYIKEVAEIVYTADGQIITAEQMLERFLFPRPMQWTYVRRLSGGEKRRLYLLRVLMGEPNVLFLDEPTNDLDTETLSVLEDYLYQFPGVVLTVSHDRYFLDKVVDHLLVFEGNGLVSRIQGSYSELMERNHEVAQLEKPKVTIVENESPVVKEKKKLSYREQQEWNEIEDKITALEEQQQEIGIAISKAGSDYGAIAELMDKQKTIEVKLEETMERWTELSMLIEEIESNQKG